MITDDYSVREILAGIDPRMLTYQEWLSVGMALKDAGEPASVWEAWSARDAGRYHLGECDRKYASFTGGSGASVGMGTLVQLAFAHGWRLDGYDAPGLDWDATIGRREKDELHVVDADWLEARELPKTSDFDPVRQLTRYLEVLFEASETVGYVTESWEKDGRYLPSKGVYTRTAGELIEALGKCRGDIGQVIGDAHPEAGAWIRFNPLDGKGVKNENVTDYRYALVESDETDIERQNAILHELELPIVMLVHSGGKSLHAIVRIDASGYDEYRKRVNYLYEVCDKNGLKIDTQNRNPSRLSRMPGVMRKGNRQYIVAENIGKKSFDEWRDWIESVNDDLPDPESAQSVWDHMPDLSEPLIDGILRKGHKMLIAGPSKCGKSFALIELCAAIAEGGKWLGSFACAQGKVLYINLELDRASCLHRFRDVYEALGLKPLHLDNIDIWNLRGKSMPMDKLAPKLIRRCVKKGYMAIIIDPIYKVITGDENSADQMAKFCNQFDNICNEIGCAVIYCHHHSKGSQGQKKSADRASGSGVFARDPDAMLDLLELEATDALRKMRRDKAACRVCRYMLTLYQPHEVWDLPEDCFESRMASLSACKNLLVDDQYSNLLRQIRIAEDASDAGTAWRVEATLREFPRFRPMGLWFDYPIHTPDDCDALKDLDADGEQPPWKKASKKKSAKTDTRKADFDLVVSSLSDGKTPPTVDAILGYFNDIAQPLSRSAVYKKIKRFGYRVNKDTGYVIEREDGQDDD